MKKHTFNVLGLILVASIWMLGCGPKQATGPRMHYILQLDFQDWVMRQALLAADSSLGAALKASAQDHKDPFGAFQQSVTENGEVTKLHQWFPEIVTDRHSPKEAWQLIDRAWKADMERTSVILDHRLSEEVDRSPSLTLYHTEARIDVQANLLHEQEKLHKLLTADGGMDFYETEQLQDYLDRITLINARIREDRLLGQNLFELLNMNSLFPEPGGFNTQSPCVFGFVAPRDTALVMKLLCHPNFGGFFDRPTKWAWGAKPMEGAPALLQLYLLRTERGRPAMDGSHVVDANAETTPEAGLCISINMDETGATEWADLTEANIERQIAMVMGGAVWTAPTVMSRISGGKSQVTGNFDDLAEAQELAYLLKIGALPMRVMILQEEMLGK